VIDSSKATTSYRNTSSQLTGLTAATCIIKWLSKGHTKDQIIYDKFNGDKQLVSAWIDFLKDNHWVEEKEDGADLKVTKNGKTWLNRFECAAIKINDN
jgi:predicted transcriptional regulator